MVYLVVIISTWDNNLDNDLTKNMLWLQGGTLFYNFDYFGTSVWRSSRSTFGRSTGNDVSGHYKRHYFSPIFSIFHFFSPLSQPFLIEGVLGSKNLFSESCLECPKP